MYVYFNAGHVFVEVVNRLMVLFTCIQPDVDVYTQKSALKIMSC